MRSRVERNVTDFVSASEKPIEDIAAQLASMKRDMQKLSSQLVDYVNQERNSMSASARKMASDMSATLDAYGIDTDALASQVQARTSDLQKMIVKEVRANPLRAIAVTIGIGMILGALSRGK